MARDERRPEACRWLLFRDDVEAGIDVFGAVLTLIGNK